MSSNATAAQRRYWDRVAALGCIITGAPAIIAHCHNGSIVERMHEPKAKGKKLRRYHWLVLPLDPWFHTDGPPGVALDLDVALWEAKNGRQADHIDRLCVRFCMDLWALANVGRK